MTAVRSQWHRRVNLLVLGWLLAGAAVAIAHRAVPDARWLMTHLVLLGGVSTAILIWSAHFAEAVRRRPLRGGHRDQAIRLAGHTAGALTVIAGITTGQWPVVLTGAVLIAAVAGWHTAVLWDQGSHALAARLGWTVSFFVTATLALPVGITFGVLLARPGVTAPAHDRLYVAHAATMLLGWVALTVVGTLVTLWPTMLRVRVAPGAELAARHGLVVLVAGLATVLAGAGTGSLPVAAAGAAVYLLGLVRASWPLVAEARQRPPASFATWSVAAAWFWLIGSVAAWAVMLATAPSWGDGAARVGTLLAPLAVGFAGQVLLGSLTYLLPVVLGGGPAAVRAAAAVTERAGVARIVLVNAGLGLYFLPVPSLTRVGLSVLVLGALLATPGLLLRAAALSRRTDPAVPHSIPVQQAVPVPLAPLRRARLVQGIAAGAALALVVVLGVVADPVGGASSTTADDAPASAAANLDLAGDPGAGFEARDAALPPATDERLHRVRLEAREIEREVAPGVRQLRWTFGGTAPGPVLRGKVGDVFEITLVNDGSLGHPIDLHAGALAPDQPMRTIEPGHELTYRFTATHSGIWLYHCAATAMSLQVANGMFGAVIIDPPDLPAVDREYLLVQSELYLGRQGGSADEAKLAAQTPDAVVFNGYANQYDHAPLTARAGERVRLWVLDAGPNRSSAFHLVGGQFDTVFAEGGYLLGGPRADPGGTGGSAVLGLSPAQGGFVELVPPQAGRYPFVSHALVDAERGAHGVLDVAP